MRNIQKKLLGMFAGGVLLTGIGTGIALVEYSTLSYGGHKIIGEDKLVTDTFIYELEDIGNEVVLLEGFDYNASHLTEVIEDSSIPSDEIQYEVTYNANRVRPYIWSNGESDSVSRHEESLRVGLGMDYFRNDFADFMESKDLILSELKNHTVSTYESTYVTNVVIKLNPETMERIRKVH